MNSLEGVDLVALGERLRIARSRSGLTQNAAAVKLGLARTTLVAIEQGQRRIKPDELIAMAHFTGRRSTNYIGSPQFKSIWFRSLERCRVHRMTRPSLRPNSQRSRCGGIGIRTLVGSSPTPQLSTRETVLPRRSPPTGGGCCTRTTASTGSWASSDSRYGRALGA